MQTRSDTTETTILDKIVADFETDPTLVAALTTLGISPWVAELKTPNVTFNDKFLERNKKYTLKHTQSASELKPKVVKVYEELIMQINSRNYINTTGKYLPLQYELNTLIAQYNAKIHTHTTPAISTNTPSKV